MNAINPEPAAWARLEEAIRLRKTLLTAPPYDGELPDGTNTRLLFSKWLKRENLFVCQKLTSRCSQSCEGNRCSCQYWLDHCGLVAQLMQVVAEGIGQPVNLYRAAGLLHDLDYPAAPHFPAGPEGDEGHPVPVVRDLVDLGVPPILSLAVLEHSPHLGFEPSSRLSAALIACDEAATLHAFGAHSPDFADVPATVAEILARRAGDPRIRTGTVRPNVRERMRLAFETTFCRTRAFPIQDTFCAGQT